MFESRGLHTWKIQLFHAVRVCQMEVLADIRNIWFFMINCIVCVQGSNQAFDNYIEEVAADHYVLCS